MSQRCMAYSGMKYDAIRHEYHVNIGKIMNMTKQIMTLQGTLSQGVPV